MRSTSWLCVSLFFGLLVNACSSNTVNALKPSDAAEAGELGTDSTSPASDSADSTTPTDSSSQAEAMTDSGVACKRGIAYDLPTLADAQALGSRVHWFYNWAQKPNASLPIAQVTQEFVPMVWNSNYTVSNVESGIPAGAKYLLGFNEPNFTTQANMTPTAAAAAWANVTTVATAKGLKIVSPAVNYCDKCVLSYSDGGADNSPYDWLDQFTTACSSCQVDYIAFHWYACSLSALKSTVTNYKKYNKPLWITELACMDDATAAANATTQLQYMQQAVAYLETEPAVVRYAWFTGRWTGTAAVALLAGDGQLTALGQAYATASESCNP